MNTAIKTILKHHKLQDPFLLSPRLAQRKIDSLGRSNSQLLLLLLGRWPSADNVILVLNRHTLGHVADLVHADQPCGEFEHVVPKGDDNELSVLRPFLDVIGDD